MIRPAVTILSLAAIFASLCGCGSESRETLYVYCDEVLKPAASAVVRKFEAESGYTVKLLCDPEDRVFRRMKLSNHADLYISMIPLLIERTVGLGLSERAEPICHIVPAMITAPLNPRDIDSFDDFKKADIRFGFCEEDTILGETTKRLFEKNDFSWEEAFYMVHRPTRDEKTLITGIQDNLIDVGIVWDVTVRHAERVGRVEIVPGKNVGLPVVALKLTKAEYPEVAARLVRFMKSPVANEIWEENGLVPYGGTEPSSL